MEQPAAVAQLDSDAIREALDARGFWVSTALLDPLTCAEIAQFYDAEDVRFRSTVSMARFGFGQGEYKYFAHRTGGESMADSVGPGSGLAWPARCTR